MNVNGELGRKMLNALMVQVGQFRQLMHLGAFNKLERRPETARVRASRDMGIVPKSCNLHAHAQNTKKSKKTMIKQNSLQKLLKIYKQKQSTQLKNPFTKIHLRRANSSQSHHQEPTQFSKQKEKQKQNQRYEQIKQYYENKYEGRSSGLAFYEEKLEMGKIENNLRVGTGTRKVHYRRKG